MKLKFLLLLLLAFNSNAQPSWEIPLDQQKWNWIIAGTSDPELNKFVLIDLTKMQPTESNSFIFPAADWDSKDNKWITGTSWYKSDCNNRRTENLGFYTNGGFSLSSNPQKMPSGSVGDTVMIMLCGIKSETNKTIFGMTGVKEGKGISYLGVIPEEIKLSTSDPNVLEVIVRQYDTSNGKLGYENIHFIDCKKQTAFYQNQPNTVYDLNSDDIKVRGFKYLSKFSCDYAEKNLWAQNNNNNKSRDLNKAKDKCSALGFKPKTEKHGACVLELIK